MKKANALNVIDKITARQLRRIAREEIRALKKAGAVVVDAEALERNVKNVNWLLANQNNIREKVRKQADITLENGVVINYAEYIQAVKNWRKYNLSVATWNALNAEKIKTGEYEARKEKPFTLGKGHRQTQERANAYLTKWLKLSSPKKYFADMRQMFIDNAMKAIESAIQNLPNADSLSGFFRSMLEQYVPEHGKKHVNIEDYYEPQKVYTTLSDIAEEFKFESEWKEFKDAYGIRE